jgi:hypothetical protein
MDMQSIREYQETALLRIVCSRHGLHDRSVIVNTIRSFHQTAIMRIKNFRRKNGEAGALLE